MGTRAITARTPRSTGGTSMPRRPPRGCAGAITTRRRSFPYARLVEENARRGHADREFELADTGIFDEGRYWAVAADYAKASPTDVCLRLRITNAGPEAAELHVLPTLWFRNRWSWGDEVPRPEIQAVRPPAAGQAAAVADEERLGRWRLVAGPHPDGHAPELLFCENETNGPRLFGAPGATPYPKDGINDHVIRGARPSIRSAAAPRCRAGTGCGSRPVRPWSSGCALRARTAGRRPVSARNSSEPCPIASARRTSSTQACDPGTRRTTRRR